MSIRLFWGGISVPSIALLLGLAGCHDERASLELLNEQYPRIVTDGLYGSVDLWIRSEKGLEALVSSSDSVTSPCTLTIGNVRFQKKDAQSLCRFPVFSLDISDCTFDSSALAPFVQTSTIRRVNIRRSPFAKDRDTYPDISTLTDEMASELEISDEMETIKLYSCNRFSGVGLSSWDIHPGMQNLVFNKCGVNDAGIKVIAKTFPGLKEIWINTVDDEQLTLEGCLELAKIPGMITPGLSGPALPDLQKRREYFARYREEYRKIHGPDSIRTSDINYFLRVE